MDIQFQGATRAGAIRVADDWWKAQKGVRLINRYIFAVGQGPMLNEMSKWKVVVHYERVHSWLNPESASAIKSPAS